MKSILFGVILSAFAGSALAQHPYQRPGSPSLNHYHHHHHYRVPPRVHNRNWVAPAIITGIGTAIIIDHMHRRNYPGPVVVEEVLTPVPVTPIPQCSSWREVQLGDGTVYRERICTQ